ncbi:MAG: tail fiber protein [bacterium]|nr:tail fiber protein [bacterium]
MKKLINLKMRAFFLIAVLAVTGCEAGLTSNDSSGSGDGEFSFSDMYSNMTAMKEEIQQLKTTISELQGASESGIQDLRDKVSPPGTINPFAGDTVPEGWLLCDGQAYGRTEHSELFQAIGTAWGTPDGSRFNVPDLRGVFLRGVDRGTGKDPDAGSRGVINPGGNTGNNVGSYQVDEFESHFHYMELYWGGWDTAPNFNHWLATGGDRLRGYGGRNTDSAGGSTETRPKNAYVNYIIKY